MIATRLCVTESVRPPSEPASETGEFVVGTVSYLEDANQTPIAYMACPPVRAVSPLFRSGSGTLAIARAIYRSTERDLSWRNAPRL